MPPGKVLVWFVVGFGKRNGSILVSKTASKTRLVGRVRCSKKAIKTYGFLIFPWFEGVPMCIKNLIQIWIAFGSAADPSKSKIYVDLC